MTDLGPMVPLSADNFEPKGTPGPCGTDHDPMPWLGYTMQTGSAGGWRGSDKFKPREMFCQDLACYQKAREQKVSDD